MKTDLFLIHWNIFLLILSSSSYFPFNLILFPPSHSKPTSSLNWFVSYSYPFIVASFLFFSFLFYNLWWPFFSFTILFLFTYFCSASNMQRIQTCQWNPCTNFLVLVLSSSFLLYFLLPISLVSIHKLRYLVRKSWLSHILYSQLY